MNYKTNNSSNNSQGTRASDYTSALSSLNNSNRNSFKSALSSLNNSNRNSFKSALSSLNNSNINSFKSSRSTLNNTPESVINHSTSKNNTNETDEKCKKKKWWNFPNRNCKRYNGKYRSKKWYDKRYENCEGLTKKECKSEKVKKKCVYKSKKCELNSPNNTNETDEKCKKKKRWSFNKSDCKRYNGKYRSKKWYGKRYENCEGLTKKECKSPKGKKKCDYKDYNKRCELKTPPGTPQHNAAIEYKSGKFNDFEQFLINHQLVQEMIKAREEKISKTS
jgi:hypothetical protein